MRFPTATVGVGFLICPSWNHGPPKYTSSCPNHSRDEVLAVTVASVGDDAEEEAQSGRMSATHDVLQVTSGHPLYSTFTLGGH